MTVQNSFWNAMTELTYDLDAYLCRSPAALHWRQKHQIQTHNQNCPLIAPRLQTDYIWWLEPCCIHKSVVSVFEIYKSLPLTEDSFIYGMWRLDTSEGLAEAEALANIT